MQAFSNPAVAQAFDAFPAPSRATLLSIRTLIFETAAGIDGVGPLDETLKWGEPAYLTTRSRSGSTIRLGWKKSKPDQCAVYFICHTNLVDTFRSMFPRELRFDGNRAIVLPHGEAIDRPALALCIAAALTYHRDKPTSQQASPTPAKSNVSWPTRPRPTAQGSS